MKNTVDHKRVYQAASFLIPLIIFIYTLAPDVMFIDSGELAASSANLGIAHPTGYPLFTLIANLFSKLPLGEVIYRLNLMCAVVSSAALFILFNLMVFLLNGLKLNDDERSENKVISNNIIYNVSLASVLILAFSKTFWDSANSLEVYSLHTFFLILNIYLFLKAISVNPNDSLKDKYWIIFSFVLGLSFTNHLSTIFLAPAFLYLYFVTYGFNQTSLKFILKLAIPFLLGYSVYIYLFIRADNPVISWGDPGTLDNLWKHVWAKQFTNLFFGSSEIAGAQLSYFFKNFPLEFFYVPLLLVIPGIIEMRKQSKKLFLFIILLFAFNILIAVNYNIFDIDTYFLLSIIVSAIWIGYGILFIVKKFKKNSLALSYVFILIFMIPLISNFAFNNKRNDLTIRDYVNNIYRSVPENSIIITTQWNYIVSPALYYKLVKNERPDLAIINKEQLSERWYINFIKNHYPDVYNKSKAEFDLYLIELEKFQSNNSIYTNPVSANDNQQILKFQNAFNGLMNSIVEKNYADKKIFTTYEVEEDKQALIAKEYYRIPQGLLFRLSKENKYEDYKDPEFEFNLPVKNDYYNNFIKNSYLQSYMGRANFLMANSKFDDAESQVQRSLNIDPNSLSAKQLLTKIRNLKTQKSN